MKEGVSIDWPIRYKDIAPWYDYVERFIGVSGKNEGLPQLPDGQFIPPFEMNCLEKHLRKSIEEKFKERNLIQSGWLYLRSRITAEANACQEIFVTADARMAHISAVTPLLCRRHTQQVILHCGHFR